MLDLVYIVSISAIDKAMVVGGPMKLITNRVTVKRNGNPPTTALMVYRMSNANFSKLLDFIAHEKPFELDWLSREVGAIAIDITDMTPEAAKNALCVLGHLKDEKD